MPKGKATEEVHVYISGPLAQQFQEYLSANPELTKSTACRVLLRIALQQLQEQSY